MVVALSFAKVLFIISRGSVTRGRKIRLEAMRAECFLNKLMNKHFTFVGKHGCVEGSTFVGNVCEKWVVFEREMCTEHVFVVSVRVIQL